MSKNSETLIVFAKARKKGEVKTRLARSMGDESALSVYEKLLEITKKATEGLAFKKVIYFANGMDLSFWSGDFIYEEQSGGDLGERMSSAFRDSCRKEGDRAVIIGTDWPGISSAKIRSAFDALDQADIVLAPAEDGGYVLLGMKGYFPELFTGIKWSTDSVYQATMDRIENCGLDSIIMEMERDIDEPEDLDSFPWLIPPGVF